MNMIYIYMNMALLFIGLVYSKGNFTATPTFDGKKHGFL